MSNPLKGRKLVIIGLGLIGGSVARGLAGRGLCRDIVGVGRREDVLRQAEADGSVSSWSTDIAQACVDADLILIAVPSLTVESTLAAIGETDAVITDAASVKGEIVRAAQRVYGSVPANFVPGHPIAGSEHSGYAASTSSLFSGKKAILTPLEHTSPEAVALVRALWETLGAQVLDMSVERHDAVLAATSHLPHLLAFALVDTLSKQGESEEIFRYAAGGFRDFTRIASSDPQMWHDVFMTNGDATITVLDEYIQDLHRLRKAVQERNSAELMDTFRRAKKSRDKFLEMLSGDAASE